MPREIHKNRPILPTFMVLCNNSDVPGDDAVKENLTKEEAEKHIELLMNSRLDGYNIDKDEISVYRQPDQKDLVLFESAGIILRV